jgi:hypothetical protein
MRYYVNKNEDEDGDHEVHKDGCYWLSIAIETEYLGSFTNCRDAVSEAKRRGYISANGCVHCSKLCHTG